MSITFTKLVQEEFEQDFNLVWPPMFNGKKCIINHKKNPDTCVSCLCPGITKYSYTLTLEADSGGAPKVTLVDNMVSSPSGAYGNAAHGMTGHGNASSTTVQKVSRIENRLREQHSNAEAVKAETMEERGSTADEIAKLKKLHDDGVLNDEEFEKAKANALEKS